MERNYNGSGRMSIAMVNSKHRAAAALLAAAVCLAFSSALEADDFGIDLPVVDRIVILGNRSFEDDILKKRMRTRESRFYQLFGKPRFRRDFLRRDLEAIKESFAH